MLIIGGANDIGGESNHFLNRHNIAIITFKATKQ